MTRFFLAITLAFCSLCLPAHAAPIPKTELPMVYGQFGSCFHFQNTSRQVLMKYLPPTLAKQFQEGIIESMEEDKNPWLESGKPFGFYAILNDRLDQCAGVILIPVTDEEGFLNELRTGWKAKIETSEKRPGYYTIDAEKPPVELPTGVRFLKGYAYLCLGDQNALDEKKLFFPSQIINEKEKAMALLTVEADRIPKGLKAVFKELYKEKIEAPAKELHADEKTVYQPLVSLGQRYLDLLCEEVKTVRFRLEWSTQKNISVEVEITPIEKSKLAKTYAERKTTVNPFGSLVTKDVMHYQTLQLPTFAPELGDTYKATLELYENIVTKSALENMIPQEVMVGIKEFTKVGTKTIKGDGLDSIFVINGPNKAGEYGAVFAMTLKDTDELAKKLPGALKGISKEMAELVKINATKIGSVDVHEIDLEGVIKESQQKLTGAKPKVLFAIGKDRGVITFGADALDLMKQALEAKPTEMPARTVVLNGKKFKAFVDNAIEAEGVKKIDPPKLGEYIDMLGNQDNITLSEWTIKGGDKLTLRLNIDNWMMYPMSQVDIVGIIMRFSIPRKGLQAPVVPKKNDDGSQD